MGGKDAGPLMNASLQATSAGRFLSHYVAVGSVDWLNHDPRLSFVLDLERGDLAAQCISPLAFCNPALQQSLRLHRLVLGIFGDNSAQLRPPEEAAFVAWIIEQTKSKRTQASKVFFDTLWTAALFPNNFCVISGLDLAQCDLGSGKHIENAALCTPQDLAQPTLALGQVGEPVQALEPLKKPTREIWPPPGFGNSAYMCWLREFDWTTTPLGPTETWPRLLKQACEVMLATPDPATIFWGRDLLLIYNEAYVALAGNKHPAMMGGSSRVHWREVWDQYDPLFDKMFLDGQPLVQDNTQLFIHRSGYLEEGFFNLRVLPLMDADGVVVGFYEPVAEVTKQTLSERRMHMLLKLSERTSPERSVRGVWDRLLEVLSGHPSDVHFAVLYQIERQSQSVPSTHYRLEGSIGIGMDSRCFPRTLTTEASGECEIGPYMRRAHESGELVVLSAGDGSLSSSILRGLEEAGMHEMPRGCVVCPVSSSVDHGVEALLILGTSSRRPYDEDYELFVNLLVGQIENTITSVKLLEKEKEKARKQAAYESELKFKKFAETAQVGIFSFDPEGNITFCNDSWLKLSGHDRDDLSAMSWTDDVHPDNVAEIKGYWDKIVNLEGPQTFEVQYKKPWKPSHLTDDSISLDRTWVLASAYAEVSSEGEMTAILGCVTDISSFKWVDQLQSQRLSEALELKRQQENFLDITSHEMRNPLNAILHCAAELIEILPGLVKASESGSATNKAKKAEMLAECLEASRTIVYCGRHQKRIIDDVLTLSKLDSNLLTIAPVETRPLDLIQEVLRVFDTEIRASDIKTKTELTSSYTALQIDTLLVDRHRLLQILINLVANAVKFTKGESLRSLRVVIGAHETEPVGSNDGVRYVPSGRRPVDPTTNPEWGTGDVVFLHFSIQDTGPGMSREEADMLFNRFAQASPRTHVQYGGSGLGLFISRELAESHGGRIGMSSELGHGSTFDFYVKGRRPTASNSLKSHDRSVSTAYIEARSAPETTLAAKPSLALSDHASSLAPIMKDVHVLIVEDNIINQKILAKLIRKQGWEVSVANHGEEALTEIDKSTWRQMPSPARPADLKKLDVVLADIEMPVMNGKEFVRQVRRLQREGVLAEHIPVIAVTGNARSEQMREAQEFGFDQVISKPYKEVDIISLVFKYIR
jgi:PAS domain S-box-containing protein